MKKEFPSSQDPRVRDLLLRHGRNTMCWQVLNPGFSFWFSSGGQGMTAYVRRGNLLVTAGAPVAPEEKLDEVAREFEQSAASRGLSVCYFGAEKWFQKKRTEYGQCSSILLGAQPVWNPRIWREQLNFNRSVSSLIRTAVRRGVSIEETPAELASDPGYRRCLNEWMRSRKLPALGFLVNPDILQNLDGRKLLTARRAGKIIAFLTLTSMPERNGWLIEHIIRGREAVRGTSELLIDRAMSLAVENGILQTTLGLAPFSRNAGLSYRKNPVWIRKIFSALYHGMGWLYNFSGLDNFKAKFKPEFWEPVYLIVNRPRVTPSIFYDVAGAFCRMSPVKFLALGLVRLFWSQMDGF